MTPSVFLSNLITFNPISACFNVQVKAKQRGISKRNVLIRQSRLRANFHESILGLHPNHYNITPKLEVIDMGAVKHYFVVALPGKTTVVGFGYTAKEAYTAFYSYIRNDGKNKDCQSRAKADLVTYLVDKQTIAAGKTPNLMTSDILAPKHGRIVN